MKKGLLIGSIIALTVVAAGVAVIGVGSKGFTDWETDNWFSDLKENTGNPDENPDGDEEEPLQFYSVEGTTAEEVITNLAEGKEWVKYEDIDIETNRFNFYLYIVKNYNTVLVEDESGAFSINSLVSGNYMYYYRSVNYGPTEKYNALVDFENKSSFNLDENDYFTDIGYDYEAYSVSMLDSIYGIENISFKNYKARNALLNATDNTINRGSTRPFAYYLDCDGFKVWKLDNVSDYYFLPNNLTYQLDFKTVTKITSVPSYEADVKDKLNNFFKLD